MQTFDLICHECDTKLDHSKLKWEQQRHMDVDPDDEFSRKHFLSRPTCLKETSDHLFDVEAKFAELLNEIRSGKKITGKDMLTYMANHDDLRSEVYEKFMGNDMLRITTGKKFRRDAELPNKTFGYYEFTYISNCPNCDSELETPWRGIESNDVAHCFGIPKPRNMKCDECNNDILYREQFWYVYFTKKDHKDYESHLVTICPGCKSEHHHKGGYDLNFRYIA